MILPLVAVTVLFNVSVVVPMERAPFVSVSVPLTAVDWLRDTPLELSIVRSLTVEGKPSPVACAAKPL